jgi:hypothetical protein
VPGDGGASVDVEEVTRLVSTTTSTDASARAREATSKRPTSGSLRPAPRARARSQRAVEVGRHLLDLLGQPRAPADLQVGDQLGAERLDRPAPVAAAALARRAGLDRRVLEVLGPDAERDVLPV